MQMACIDIDLGKPHLLPGCIGEHSKVVVRKKSWLSSACCKTLDRTHPPSEIPPGTVASVVLASGTVFGELCV